MENNHIEFFTRSVYGNTHMYIADAKMQDLISQLTGTVTLLEHHKSVLEQLGFTFEEVFAPKK